MSVLLFEFKPTPNARFQLDGAFYTLLSVKPILNPNGDYLAKFISKNGQFIQATILGKNQEPIISAVLEVK